MKSKTKAPARHLILILGDQLSPAISSLHGADPKRDVVVMCEVRTEATYVPHHKKKIAFLFAAMRHFADELREAGWHVDYRTYDCEDNRGSFVGEIERAAKVYKPEKILVTEPGEWRVLDDIRTWPRRLGVPVGIRPDTRFVCSTPEFQNWAKGRTQLRMEYFYREMRRKTGLLMNGADPEGGQWNFDKENRKAAKADLFMPGPLRVQPDKTTLAVLGLVLKTFPHHFGDLEPFWFAVTRKDAEKALAHFLKDALPRFGDFQDAMLRNEKFLYHSVISMYLNAGLLDALDICRRVENEYRAGRVPLNAAEGYIRQIIGWREYVRGIYWLKMPDYVNENFFNHTHTLPDFYWTGETDIACLRAAITQTKEEAYAHHIQRLMITGNFALLAGISPQELHKWYLIVYADAFEWVELPNTLGMSQFGDGGLLASKPYISSGAYIDRMSDYCGSCRYNVKERTGKNACPFNALYWSFLARHQRKLDGSPRMAQMYRTYEKFAPAEKAAIRESAETFLATLKPWKA